MARELNSDLFGVKPQQAEMTAPQPIQYAKADEVRVLHLHIENISRRMKEFESRVEIMHTKVEELTTQNRSRFERVQSHFKGQTEMLQNSFSDMNGKIAQIVSRMNERRLSENSIKEMIERHASVVQTFEVRLQQMQKVMSEQELQLMHAKSELKGALVELARLKKL